jgi:CMP-N-acetylneuraminic acid synthetase
MSSELYTAVVPVRAGSRRLKNKNLAPFAGTTLLEYKIAQLKKCDWIAEIVVSSDSDAMLALAAASGATTHKRSWEYCDEKTKTFGEMVGHVCSQVRGDHILWATCTAPLISPKIYDKAVIEYETALLNGADSLISVEVFKRYLWDDNGPINYKLGIEHVPSQNLPPLYFVTYGVVMAPRLDMVKWNYFHGINPKKFIVSKREGVDIDDGLDLAVARAWLDLDEGSAQVDPFMLNYT